MTENIENIDGVQDIVNDGVPMAVGVIFRQYIRKKKIQILDTACEQLGFSEGDKIVVKSEHGKEITRTLVETIPTEGQYSNEAVCLLDKGDRRALVVNEKDIVLVRKAE